MPQPPDTNSCRCAQLRYIYIIQDNEGIVQILKILGGNFTKKVHLKYMHDDKCVGANHYVPLIKKEKLYATKPWPSGFIVIPGDESSQDVPMDLSMLQVERDQDFDEQPSLPENIITPEHSYCKSPQYTADNCDEDIQNQIKDETQSNLNEDTEQESQIPEYNESLYEVSENWENEDEANEEFEPPVPLIKSGKPFPTYLFDDLQPIEVNSIPRNIDGSKKYIVTTSDLTWKDDTSDSHYFKLSTLSKRGFGGVRKGAECKGSWVCQNSNCGFLKASKNKQLNYIH